MSAAATHYRMMRTPAQAADYRLRASRSSPSPASRSTARRRTSSSRLSACRPAACTAPPRSAWSWSTIRARADFVVKPGSLGKPVPGGSVEVQDADGHACAPGDDRRADGVAARRLDRRPRISAAIDEDGYFYHAGRADDVIISAGWTMSAVEIEDAMLKHPDVREAAAIGVPDALRGQVVKAFVVADRAGRRRLRRRRSRTSCATRLSQHEYPRASSRS